MVLQQIIVTSVTASHTKPPQAARCLCYRGNTAELKFAGDTSLLLLSGACTRCISKPTHLSSLFQCHYVLQVFDMMGYEPNMWNKMNIHIGGTYGHTPEDKQATLERFVV